MSPLRVVVSGGIGSGKSTVARMLADLGAVVIETDSIGHQVL
ncbi:MAG: dephospho-CoA kinase, partial [bacterium]|nr:dephospho-CoA kinase [bacterium]